MNSKRKGGIAIGVAIAYFSQKYTVFVPVTDCEKYDLIVDQSGILNRIEVKYTSSVKKNGIHRLDLRTFGGYREKVYDREYIASDFDFLFVYCSNQNSFLIPMKEVVGMKAISLGNRYSKYRV